MLNLLLLKFALDNILWRNFVVMGLSYLIFFVCFEVLVRIAQNDPEFLASVREGRARSQRPPLSRETKQSLWGSFEWIGEILFSEIWFVGLGIVVLAGVLIFIDVGGSTLVVDVIFEAVLATSLSKVLRTANRTDWRFSLFRATIWIFLLVLLFSEASLKMMSDSCPEANTILQMYGKCWAPSPHH